MRDIYSEWCDTLDHYYFDILEKKLLTRKLKPNKFDRMTNKLHEWDDTFIDRYHIKFAEREDEEE